jgi:hypothetical protein
LLLALAQQSSRITTIITRRNHPMSNFTAGDGVVPPVLCFASKPTNVSELTLTLFRSHGIFPNSAVPLISRRARAHANTHRHTHSQTRHNGGSHACACNIHARTHTPLESLLYAEQVIEGFENLSCKRMSIKSLSLVSVFCSLDRSPLMLKSRVARPLAHVDQYRWILRSPLVKLASEA